jgi:hypothetical protein
MSVKRFRLKVDGEVQTFEMGSQADVTLRDFILLEQETLELGKAFTMGDIVRLAEKFEQLTPDQAKHDPEGAWQLAATIWLAMVRKARQSGDLTVVPFARAIDADLSSFEPIPEPGDHQPGKAKKRPPASGQGAKRPARKASPAV